ncbi:hypothetical protein B0H14DRAFT_2572572 [Mycena olivaceomarginata]|nr:hypothetical protein B0H14DRAFT_2572572 [Mycena olivaceomarginata]
MKWVLVRISCPRVKLRGMKLAAVGGSWRQNQHRMASVGGSGGNHGRQSGGTPEVVGGSLAVVWRQFGGGLAAVRSVTWRQCDRLAAMWRQYFLKLDRSNISRVLRLFSWLKSVCFPPAGPQLIPYFDEQGVLIGLVRVPPDFDPSQLVHQAAANPTPDIDIGSDSDISSPPTPLRRFTVASQFRVSPEIEPNSTAWDGWPNGKFERSFSKQELSETQDLGTNWVLETLKNRGTRSAATWKKGRETRRRCLGVIECHGRTCSMILEPAVRAIDRHRQLQHECDRCGETLGHRTCGVESSLYHFQGGGFFIHCGFHNHSRFTHSSLSQANGSLSFVEYNPKYPMVVEPMILRGEDEPQQLRFKSPSREPSVSISHSEVDSEEEEIGLESASPERSGSEILLDSDAEEMDELMFD